MPRILAIAILLLNFVITFSAEGEILTFSYNPNGIEPTGYGYNKPDLYEVAIQIKDPGLAGKEICSIDVIVPDDGGSQVNPMGSAWIIPSLPEGEITSENSLALVNTEIAQGRLHAEFPEGILLPEEGVYVGYTIESTEIYKGSRHFPVAVIDGDTENALLIRTRNHYRWDQSFSRLGQISAMEVGIKGNFPPTDYTLSLPTIYHLKANEDNEIVFSIANTGKDPLQSATLRFLTEAGEVIRDYIFDPAIPARYGAYRNVISEIPVREDYGNSELKIFQVKGNENKFTQSPRSWSTIIRALPVIPKSRPLVEEYTGLWCGSCPAGYVALEEMKEKYDDDFIAIVYHIDDILQTHIAPPNSVRNVPTIYLNRHQSMGADSLEQYWLDESEKYCPADLQVNIEWTSQSRTALRATATTTFMENIPDAFYKIGMALVADGLNNPSWGQTNYYSGQNRSGKYWDIFSKGGGIVYGLDFNNSLCQTNNINGVSGPIPFGVKEFEPYSAETVFQLSDAVSGSGVRLAGDKDNLRVVAFLVKAGSQEILTSATSVHSVEANVSSGIDKIEQSLSSNNSVPSIMRYFTLSGQEISNPSRGAVLIKMMIYGDGNVKCEKIIF